MAEARGRRRSGPGSVMGFKQVALKGCSNRFSTAARITGLLGHGAPRADGRPDAPARLQAPRSGRRNQGGFSCGAVQVGREKQVVEPAITGGAGRDSGPRGRAKLIGSAFQLPAGFAVLLCHKQPQIIGPARCRASPADRGDRARLGGSQRLPLRTLRLQTLAVAQGFVPALPVRKPGWRPAA